MIRDPSLSAKHSNEKVPPTNSCRRKEDNSASELNIFGKEIKKQEQKITTKNQTSKDNYFKLNKHSRSPARANPIRSRTRMKRLQGRGGKEGNVDSLTAARWRAGRKSGKERRSRLNARKHDGARSRGRTGTGLPPRDFKSLASTDFAIRAGSRFK